MERRARPAVAALPEAAAPALAAFRHNTTAAEKRRQKEGKLPVFRRSHRGKSGAGIDRRAGTWYALCIPVLQIWPRQLVCGCNGVLYLI